MSLLCHCHYLFGACTLNSTHTSSFCRECLDLVLQRSECIRPIMCRTCQKQAVASAEANPCSGSDRRVSEARDQCDVMISLSPTFLAFEQSAKYLGRTNRRNQIHTSQASLGKRMLFFAALCPHVLPLP